MITLKGFYNDEDDVQKYVDNVVKEYDDVDKNIGFIYNGISWKNDVILVENIDVCGMCILRTNVASIDKGSER